MRNEKFYDIIDVELSAIILEFNTEIGKRNIKQDDQKKGFAFLIWIMRRIDSKISNDDILNYITEGEEDNSCDFIMPYKGLDNSKMFAVVQAKWKSKKNANKATKGFTTVAKSTVSDFSKIARLEIDTKTRKNQNFIKNYKLLKKHIGSGKKVNYVLISMSLLKTQLYEEIEKFEDANNAVELINTLSFYSFLDLKKFYFEKHIRGRHNISFITKGNISEIDTKIPNTSQNCIEVDKPIKAYVFSVNSQVLYNWFENFGYSLFVKNIRNPLSSSNYNKAIKHSVLNDSDKFWYYNNGITGIVKSISFTPQSKSIDIKNLQIINGAQTIFSIYSALKELKASKRSSIGKKTKITLRLIVSSSDVLSNKIIEYNNSQNAIVLRDFRSNDDVQERLQKDFLNHTNILYETRRGDFVDKYKRNLLSNEKLGLLYLSYYLKKPILAKENKRFLFLNKTTSITKGLYETVFNSKTKHDDMLIAYNLFIMVERERRILGKKIKTIKKKINDKKKLSKPEKVNLELDFVSHTSYNVLAAFKFILPKLSTNLIFTKSRILNNKYIHIELVYNYIIQCLVELVQKKGEGFDAKKYFKSNGASVKELEKILTGRVTKFKKKNKSIEF